MPLTLSPVRKSSSTSEGADSDYDVLCERRYVGRIARANSTSRGAWYWAIAFRPHHRSGPHHGHASDRQAALIAFHEIWKQIRTRADLKRRSNWSTPITYLVDSVGPFWRSVTAMCSLALCHSATSSGPQQTSASPPGLRQI